MSAAITEVRVFLAGVAGSGVAPTQVPQLLLRLVRSVARGRDEADLAQDLALDLLVRTRARQPGGIADLLTLDDAGLVAALRRRLVQVSVTSPGSRWALVKTVRAHVRTVMAAPLPTVVGPPVSLVVNDRIQRQRVAEAVTWFVAQPGSATADAKAIAAWVVTTYFPGPTAEDLYGAGANSEHLEAALDGPRIANDLRRHLGPVQARVVAKRAAGTALKDLAREQGVALSSAHARVCVAIGRTRDRTREAGWSREAVGVALSLLEAA